MKDFLRGAFIGFTFPVWVLRGVGGRNAEEFGMATGLWVLFLALVLT